MQDPIKELLRETTLKNCNDHHSFVFVNGKRANNLMDFAKTIATLQDHEFRHHVSQDGNKNHFATWVHHIFNNPYLARDLGYTNNLQSKTQMAKTICHHVNWLNRE